ncbi:MAG TPA: hypothetical protein PLU11_13765 [Chitinophagaceae bacterium]|jgi:hypothetical protein|nr:hypothetical protein [Chitinophagaceae bacterium]HPN60247.1 hypothetical protein [Chitinophagaceae bacterium]
MNLLFRAKYKYKLNESPAQVKAELETLFSTPWHKTAPRLSGYFSNDFSFKIRSVLSTAVAFFGIFQSFAVLQGRLQAEEERTVIRLTARPGTISLLLFYALVVVTILAAVKAQAALTPETIVVAAALTGLLISYYFILRFSRNSLRRYFQRQMGIKSK